MNVLNLPPSVQMRARFSWPVTDPYKLRIRLGRLGSGRVSKSVCGSLLARPDQDMNSRRKKKGWTDGLKDIISFRGVLIKNRRAQRWPFDLRLCKWAVWDKGQVLDHSTSSNEQIDLKQIQGINWSCMKAEEIVMGISRPQFKAMTAHLPLSYIVRRIGKIIRWLILIDYPILPMAMAMGMVMVIQHILANMDMVKVPFGYFWTSKLINKCNKFSHENRKHQKVENRKHYLSNREQTRSVVRLHICWGTQFFWPCSF